MGYYNNKKAITLHLSCKDYGNYSTNCRLHNVGTRNKRDTTIIKIKKQ